jgi:hypothetical protein
MEMSIHRSFGRRSGVTRYSLHTKNEGRSFQFYGRGSAYFLYGNPGFDQLETKRSFQFFATATQKVR